MNKKSDNLLDYYPGRLLEWELDADERVVLLKPRFKNRWAEKVFVPKLTSRYIKITLDQYGSWVWQRIDGKTTVHQLGDKLVQEFGEKIQPVYERLGLFIKLLARNRFINLESDQPPHE